MKSASKSAPLFHRTGQDDLERQLRALRIILALPLLPAEQEDYLIDGATPLGAVAQHSESSTVHSVDMSHATGVYSGDVQIIDA